MQSKISLAMASSWSSQVVARLIGGFRGVVVRNIIFFVFGYMIWQTGNYESLNAIVNIVLYHNIEQQSKNYNDKNATSQGTISSTNGLQA